MGSEGLLTRLVRAGATYRQHTRFAQKALTADDAARRELLQDYVTGLSEASFNGFKIAVQLLANNERGQQRKESLASLLHEAGSVRAGQAVNSPDTNDDTMNHAPEELDREEQMLEDLLLEETDNDRRMRSLVDYVLTLDAHQYSSFAERMQNGNAFLRRKIRDHDENELKAWGPYYEDQVAYFWARERTGQKDPKWTKTYNELKAYLQTWETMTQASDAAWNVKAANA